MKNKHIILGIALLLTGIIACEKPKEETPKNQEGTTFINGRYSFGATIDNAIDSQEVAITHDSILFNKSYVWVDVKFRFDSTGKVRCEENFMRGELASDSNNYLIVEAPNFLLGLTKNELYDYSFNSTTKELSFAKNGTTVLSIQNVQYANDSIIFNYSAIIPVEYTHSKDSTNQKFASSITLSNYKLGFFHRP